MGGFPGVVPKTDCVGDVFYGTDARFRAKFDDDLNAINGSFGIGIMSDDEDQSLIIAGKFGTFAMVSVGETNNFGQTR